MAALQQQAASPEEALVDKVLGAEQPTGRLYRGLITALRDDAETAEGLAAARKILKALAARAPALAEDRHARLWRALCDAISQGDGLLAERAFCLREVVSANATRVKDALDGIARAAAADADDVMRTGLAQCLADVVERCPQGRAEVTSSVRKAWPYVNSGEETHDGYTRFVIDALRCCDDKGPLLTTCVERALALDCAAAQQVFAMDEDEAKDAAADKVVSRLIAYVAKTCVSDTDAELLLQATLGPCLATPRAQTAPFVVFAAAATTPTKAAAFCRTLSALVSDEATADARRAAAIAYLSSFVCRAAVVDARARPVRTRSTLNARRCSGDGRRRGIANACANANARGRGPSRATRRESGDNGADLSRRRVVRRAPRRPRLARGALRRVRHRAVGGPRELTRLRSRREMYEGGLRT